MIPEAWAPFVGDEAAANNDVAPPREKRGLGGTEAGALLAHYMGDGFQHLTKYKTAADVYMRLVHDIDGKSSALKQRGIREEPRLRALYQRDIAACGPSAGVVWHPNGWASCSPDALPPWAVVEFKTTTVFARKSWGPHMTDEVAPYYLPQCLWNCLLTNRPEAHLLVAFGVDDKATGEFHIEDSALYVVERDAALEKALFECAERFMHEFVLPRTPPPVEPKENKRVYKRILRGEEP